MSQNFATWLGKSNLARKNDIAALVKKKKTKQKKTDFGELKN